jgi:nicotinamidase-related amidase
MAKRRDSIGGPASSLLSPNDCMLLMIDYQPTSFFTVQSIDRQILINNVLGLAKTAKAFDIPTVLTTVVKDEFSGPQLPELQDVFPDLEPIDRTGNNPWEDERIIAEVRRIGREKLLMAGLWTENCVALPALSALEDGYEVYVVADACGGVSAIAHEMGMSRMIQAGVRPITWQALMLELQRDWTRPTADAVNEIAKEHGGAEGQAALYAQTMVRAH